MNTNKLISWTAAALVSILAILAFILSYNSLQHLAAQNGVEGRLSYLWPLLLDFAMVVFSLAILRANLLNENALYPWFLTGAFASMATVANVLDVTTLGIPSVAIAAAVKALAPVALVLAFELLMGMVRAEVRRGEVTATLANLKAEMNARRQELEALAGKVSELVAKRDELQADVSELRHAKKAANLGNLDDANAVRMAEKSAAMEALLAYFANHPNASLAEAGRQIGRSKTTVGNYLVELEQAGRISRNGDGIQILTQ